MVKASTGSGGYWTKRIAEADDFDDSDGKSILTFYEAQDRAKQLARGGSAEADTTAPITVDRALDDYKRDLIARGASAYNADYPRRQLTRICRASRWRCWPRANYGSGATAC